MKLRKILGLIVLVILITGCSAEYNINITDKMVSEDVNIYIDKNSEDDVSSLNYYLNDDIKAFNNGDEYYYYDTKKIEGSNPGINLKFKYGNLVSYAVSSFFDECFGKSSISSDEENIYIKASNFLCSGYNYTDVSYAVINFTTNHTVVKHNADNVSNGTYTWYPITNNKDVDLTLKINETVDEEPNKSDIPSKLPGDSNQGESEENGATWIIVVLMLVAFVAAITLMALYKVNKNQRG